MSRHAYRFCLPTAEQQAAAVEATSKAHPSALEMQEHRNCLVGMAEFRSSCVVLRRFGSPQLKGFGLYLEGEALADTLTWLREEQPELALPHELLPYLVGLVERCGQLSLPALCGSVSLDPAANQQLGLALPEPLPVLVYSSEAIVANLQTVDGMSEEEAQEFFEFNIAGAWVGDGTPLFL